MFGNTCTGYTEPTAYLSAYEVLFDVGTPVRRYLLTSAEGFGNHAGNRAAGRRPHGTRGEVDASIELLQAERKFQQDSYAVNYELGYAYYIKQDFKRATKYLKSILDHPEANERVYQLLGNALDDGGKPERALKVYQKGAVKYPDVASMHVEQGILEMKRQRYDAAAAHWEQGILC